MRRPSISVLATWNRLPPEEPTGAEHLRYAADGDDSSHRAIMIDQLDPVLNMTESERRRRWLDLDPEIRKILRQLHVQFGHPTNTKLLPYSAYCADRVPGSPLSRGSTTLPAHSPAPNASPQPSSPRPSPAPAPAQYIYIYEHVSRTLPIKQGIVLSSDAPISETILAV